MTPTAKVEIEARRFDRNLVAGFAIDWERPQRPLTLEAWLDGEIAAAAVADLHFKGLARAGLASPRHGFHFAFAPGALDACRRLEIRVANRDDLPGASVDLDLSPRGPMPAAGAAEWCGGLRFAGWVDAEGEETPFVQAYVDDALVAEAPANRWRRPEPPETTPKRGFELHLPARFADGQVWSVNLRREDGSELDGSPVTFWVFADGLEATLARLAATPGQRMRGAQFDRVLPNALPFSDYAARREDYLGPRPGPARAAWAVVVLDGHGLGETLESVENQLGAEWAGVALARGRDPFTFAAAELADFTVAHSEAASWFLFVLAGLRLSPHALARLDASARDFPDASLIYADREIDAAVPLALPAFDYERMLEQGYFAPLFALPRATVDAAVAARVDNWLRLANFAFDAAGACDRAVHLPGPVADQGANPLDGAGPALKAATAAHLAARGVAAAVGVARSGAACRVRRRREPKPSVSILIPTRDRADLLRACLESIYDGAAAAGAEILVVDNDSRERRTLDVLNENLRRGVRVLPAPGPFNFAALNNFAAAEARGDYLCFLNNDVQAKDSGWLEEMLSRHADAGVGAVGAKLLWPSGGVQHGGVTLGVNFAPAHAFRDRLDDDPGYGGQLACAHETGAVTAACMTTPRALFLESGGLDALRFPINFNDVDYCLRLAARGLRIVWTPHAKLEHLESASRGRDEPADAAQRLKRELRTLRHVWGEALIADPSYSPLLALSDPPYAALACPPRPLAPRRRAIPAPRRLPEGF